MTNRTERIYDTSTMKHGADLLRVWMDRRGVSQRETADLWGWHETLLSKIMRKHRIPRLVNAIKIERETGIPVEAWLDSPVPETVGAGRGSARKHK